MAVTKKDIINAKAASEALSKCKDEIVVTDVFYDEKTDEETGEATKVMYLKTDDGRYFGTISATAIRSGDDLLDIIADEGSVRIKVLTRRSGKDRDFISLIVS